MKKLITALTFAASAAAPVSVCCAVSLNYVESERKSGESIYQIRLTKGESNRENIDPIIAYHFRVRYSEDIQSEPKIEGCKHSLEKSGMGGCGYKLDSKSRTIDIVAWDVHGLESKSAVGIKIKEAKLGNRASLFIDPCGSQVVKKILGQDRKPYIEQLGLQFVAPDSETKTIRLPNLPEKLAEVSTATAEDLRGLHSKSFLQLGIGERSETMYLLNRYVPGEFNGISLCHNPGVLDKAQRFIWQGVSENAFANLLFSQGRFSGSLLLDGKTYNLRTNDNGHIVLFSRPTAKEREQVVHFMNPHAHDDKKVSTNSKFSTKSLSGRMFPATEIGVTIQKKDNNLSDADLLDLVELGFAYTNQAIVFSRTPFEFYPIVFRVKDLESANFSTEPKDLFFIYDNLPPGLLGSVETFFSVSPNGELVRDLPDSLKINSVIPPGFSYDEVIAHELGHVLEAGHNTEGVHFLPPIKRPYSYGFNFNSGIVGPQGVIGYEDVMTTSLTGCPVGVQDCRTLPHYSNSDILVSGTPFGGPLPSPPAGAPGLEAEAWKVLGCSAHALSMRDPETKTFSSFFEYVDPAPCDLAGNLSGCSLWELDWASGEQVNGFFSAGTSSQGHKRITRDCSVQAHVSATNSVSTFRSQSVDPGTNYVASAYINTDEFLLNSGEVNLLWSENFSVVADTLGLRVDIRTDMNVITRRLSDASGWRHITVSYSAPGIFTIDAGGGDFFTDQPVSLPLDVSAIETINFGLESSQPFSATGYVEFDGIQMSTGGAGIIELQTGDANADGLVNIIDVVAIQNEIVNSIPGIGFADCNLDGTINVVDIGCTLNIVLN